MSTVRGVAHLDLNRTQAVTWSMRSPVPGLQVYGLIFRKVFIPSRANEVQFRKSR